MFSKSLKVVSCKKNKSVLNLLNVIDFGVWKSAFSNFKKNEILKQMVQPKPRFVMLIVFDNILQL